MKIELQCSNCQNKFETDYKHRNKKFCDRTCYFDFAKKNNLLGRDKDMLVREERTCVQCGNTFVERIKHEKKLCSDVCRDLWSKNEVNKKNRIDNSKKTMNEKYGVDSFFELDEFKENKKKIFIEKYGVESPMYVPQIVTKLKETFRKKHLKSLIPKLDDNHLELLDEYSKNKSGNTSQSYTFKCKKCENIFSSTVMGSGKIPICRKCFPIIKNSNLEQIIKDFLNQRNIKHIDSSRKILNGKEIDIFLPDYNVGIEVNGNYYHSEIGGGKSKNYHIDKTEISDSLGIKLIQFYEDEILLKTDIVLSKIANIVKLNETIFARKCKIREVSKKESTQFLIENHLQGDCIDKIRYGLFFKGELVSIMTFGKKRKSLGNKQGGVLDFELIRFCNKKYKNVVGGFSKMLKFFIANNNPNKIETFADCRWSGLNYENVVYHKNGFTYVKKTPPNYWYIKTDKYLNRYHRFTFRKDVLVKEGFDKNKTEWEIMRLKGYDRIWDCGSLKFELNLKG
jgi:very-short-patch-repair endonuclease/predicted nucleic acid-binding Zn ribbon protein